MFVQVFLEAATKMYAAMMSRPQGLLAWMRPATLVQGAGKGRLVRKKAPLRNANNLGPIIYNNNAR